jgi:serine/threonine protein kinase
MNAEIVDSRYSLIEQIGQGSYGTVFLAEDTEHNRKIALKFDTCAVNSSSLSDEVSVLKRLQGIKGFPKLYSYGNHNGKPYFALELLTQSVYDKCLTTHLSSKSIASLGNQVLKRIKSMHSVHLLHRDIKPQHFLLKRSKVYLVDFGTAKSYLKADSKHIELIKTKSFIGSMAFASRNAHSLIQLSRRDDLESLCYSLAYCIKGTLPWLGLDIEHNAVKKVGAEKMRVSPWVLFKGADKEYIDILQYVKSLDFYARPDYEYVEMRLRNIRNAYNGGNKGNLLGIRAKKDEKISNNSEEFMKTRIAENLPEFKDRSLIRKENKEKGICWKTHVVDMGEELSCVDRMSLGFKQNTGIEIMLKENVEADEKSAKSSVMLKSCMGMNNANKCILW